jgi:Tfp pilus assembly protein PilF
MMLPMLFMVALAAPAAPATPIDAGLAQFRKHHFKAAEAEFQKAVDADPQSAAAHFYLGYTLYKSTEPRRRLTPEKERAAEEFAKCFAIDPQFRPVWAGR